MEVIELDIAFLEYMSKEGLKPYGELFDLRSKAENILTQGDMVLAINKKLVTCFRDIQESRCMPNIGYV
nr:protease Do-like 7 [Tanacetum cinerariifolium]